MSGDVTDLRDFYASPLGQMASRTVSRIVADLWPDCRNANLLGLGYALPYLSPFLSPGRDGGGRAMAFMPASQGVVHWPADGRSASALVDPLIMPLADAAVDRVLVAHALEIVDSAEELLHEVWRVLAPGGRMIAIVPNRRGLWARLDTTPFGQGRPFSRSQLRELLRKTHLAPDSWAEALYMPPLTNRMLLGGAAIWEKVGAGCRLPFAGLYVVDAEKQLHRPIPVRAKRRRVGRAAPALVPVPAAAGRDRLP